MYACILAGGAAHLLVYWCTDIYMCVRACVCTGVLVYVCVCCVCVCTPQVVLLIFVSGKIVLTGAKEKSVRRHILDDIY